MGLKKRLFYPIVESYFNLLFYLDLVKAQKREIVIFDIDNTLANTWPLLKDGKTQKDAFKAAEVFQGVLSELLRHVKTAKNIFFLSARPYECYFTTLSWLKKNEIPHNTWKVYLVSRPKHKIKFLTRLRNKSTKSIIYYDDMSYNHENGEVRFYDEEIEQIKSLDIEYIGYNELKALQK